MWVACYNCVIKCERGNAKHNVKDDRAFLSEHAIFRYLSSRNPSTDQDEILHGGLHQEAYMMY